MLKRIATLTLLAAVAGALAAPEGHAFGKKRNKEEEPERISNPVVLLEETDRGLRAVFETPTERIGAVSENRCNRLYYGANLAMCLQVCTEDEDAVMQLTDEPAYDEVWSQVDGYRLSGSFRPATTVTDGVRVTYPEGTKRYTLQVRKNESAACTTAFNGNMCLAGYSEKLRGTDAAEQYQAELEAMASPAAALERPLADAAAEMADQVGRVRQALDDAGIEGFRRRGYFLATNLKNAPAMLCQLKSRSLGHGGADSTLLEAIQKNRKELKRSLDFLERL